MVDEMVEWVVDEMVEWVVFEMKKLIFMLKY